MFVHGLPVYRKLAFLRSESHSTQARLLTPGVCVCVECVCLSVSASQGRETRQKQSNKKLGREVHMQQPHVL